MPAKPVRIGSMLFCRKGDADRFFRVMLYKYNLGDKVSSDDAEILKSLLAGHPEAEEKYGAGIDSFSVRTAEYGTRCFWVNRTDGTSVKFSFKACY